MVTVTKKGLKVRHGGKIVNRFSGPRDFWDRHRLEGLLFCLGVDKRDCCCAGQSDFVPCGTDRSLDLGESGAGRFCLDD